MQRRVVAALAVVLLLNAVTGMPLDRVVLGPLVGGSLLVLIVGFASRQQALVHKAIGVLVVALCALGAFALIRTWVSEFPGLRSTAFVLIALSGAAVWGYAKVRAVLPERPPIRVATRRRAIRMDPVGALDSEGLVTSRAAKHQAGNRPTVEDDLHLFEEDDHEDR